MSSVKLYLSRDPYMISDGSETSAGQWKTPDRKWAFCRSSESRSWYICAGQGGWDSSMGQSHPGQKAWTHRKQFLISLGLHQASFPTRRQAIEALTLALSEIDPTSPLAKDFGVTK
jgi:hypothetical protein